MPITIYRRDSHKNKIAFLCPDSWSIAEQLYVLEAWLDSKGKYLEHGDYVADVGIRARSDFDNGVGGGAAFPPSAMAIMAEKGIYLFISEYP
jgi:glutaminase